MVQEYYENQDRTDQVNIKPGLKAHLKSIAKSIFPCAKVGPEDALEYLVAVYLNTNEIPEVRTPYVMPTIQEANPTIDTRPQEVISYIDNPPIYNEDASVVDFGSDL